jgi:hypothetical protein
LGAIHVGFEKRPQPPIGQMREGAVNLPIIMMKIIGAEAEETVGTGCTAPLFFVKYNEEPVPRCHHFAGHATRRHEVPTAPITTQYPGASFSRLPHLKNQGKVSLIIDRLTWCVTSQ